MSHHHSLVVVLASAAAVASCGAGTDDSATETTPQREEWSIVARIGVGRQPSDFPVVAFDSVWIPNSGSGTVSRIDPATSRVIATVRTGRTRGAPLGAEYVSPYALAACGGAVWATRDVSDRFGIAKIDPRSNRVVAVYRLPGSPYAVASGRGSVWVTLRNANVLVRVHPRTGRILARIPVRGPVGVVADDQQVWVASSRDNSAQLVDVARNRIAVRVRVSAEVETLALCGRTLWAASGGGSVTRIDTGAHRVIAQIEIPADPWTIDCDSDEVWAGAYQGRELFRIDPTTNTVSATVTMPSEVNGVRVGFGFLWATSAPRNLTYKLDD